MFLGLLIFGMIFSMAMDTEDVGQRWLVGSVTAVVAVAWLISAYPKQSAAVKTALKNALAATVIFMFLVIMGAVASGGEWDDFVAASQILAVLALAVAAFTSLLIWYQYRKGRLPL